MWTTTWVSALAVPVNDGVRTFEGVVGVASVTVGTLVSTLKLTGELLPSSLPSELGSTAMAVYSPSFRPGAEETGPHLPDLTVAAAVAAGLPVVFLPSKILTVTGSVSLAVPLNDGVGSLVGEAGPLIDTEGGLVLTEKWRSGLDPSPSCSATAVYSPASSGVSSATFQMPPVGASDTSGRGVPEGVWPS